MEKKSLGFYFHIYLKILAQDLKSKMNYRADFFISTFGMILTNIAGYISFWILFRNFSTIKGWTYYEILFLYGFSLIALTPAQCLLDNNWNLRQNVYFGDFIKYCFRPINLYFYYQSEVFDIKGLGQLFFGIGTVIFSCYKMDISFSLILLLKIILLLMASSLIMMGMQNFAAALCFWIQNSFYVLELVANFKDYARYPITIFNSVFKIVFTFFIPIAFIAYYPSLIIIKTDSISLLSWLSPVISTLFFILSYKFWMYGALKYNGTGS